MRGFEGLQSLLWTYCELRLRGKRHLKRILVFALRAVICAYRSSDGFLHLRKVHVPVLRTLRPIFSFLIHIYLLKKKPALTGGLVCGRESYFLFTNQPSRDGGKEIKLCKPMAVLHNSFSISQSIFAMQ